MRPGRGKVYVDNYIKAFYYGENDVMSWINQVRCAPLLTHRGLTVRGGVQIQG